MPGPIFTAHEITSWDAKDAEAKVWRDTDEVYHKDSPRPYNRSVGDRVNEVLRARSWAWVRNLRARPDEVLDLYLLALAERGKDTIVLDDLFEGKLEERVGAADTRKNRKLMHLILQGAQDRAPFLGQVRDDPVFPRHRQAGQGALGLEAGCRSSGHRLRLEDPRE